MLLSQESHRKKLAAHSRARLVSDNGLDAKEIRARRPGLAAGCRRLGVCTLCGRAYVHRGGCDKAEDSAKKQRGTS